MATSNSTDWGLNRDQAISMALRKLGVLPSGITASTSQINDCVDSVQAICKALNADGMPLWKIDSITFPTVIGTVNYSVGVGQTVSIPKPLKVIKALATPSGSDAVPMDLLNRYDFLDLPSSAASMPLTLMYINDRTTGTFSLWPQPDAVYTITVLYQSPFEDMDASTNDFDFPAEWMMAIVYLLAWAMAPEYSIPILDRQQLQKEAEYWHQYALSLGSEEGSIKFRPDNEGK